MTGLAARQDAMLAGILDEDRPLPAGWNARHAAGLAIYRNNYRSALLDALRSIYARTEKLVGEQSFERAAAHHVVTRPPTGWTLDLAGAGFAETCASLFAADPDVAELAWLEWAMHLAFVARDAVPLGMADFAAASTTFGEGEWAGLRLRFVPGLALRTVAFDLKVLWTAGEARPLAQPACCIVWREGERPAFLLLEAAEGAALEAMREGASFGEACALLTDLLGEEQAIAAAGTMLGRWLAEGLVEGLAQ